MPAFAPADAKASAGKKGFGGVLIIVVKFSSLQNELENFNNYGKRLLQNIRHK